MTQTTVAYTADYEILREWLWQAWYMYEAQKELVERSARDNDSAPLQAFFLGRLHAANEALDAAIAEFAAHFTYGELCRTY